MKAYILLCIVCVLGCRNPSVSYKITAEGVFSRFDNITQFSISKYKTDHQNVDDIRPKNHTEIMRYCCELKNGEKGKSVVLFNMQDSNYRWSFCKLDTSIITDDALRNLSFKEKLKYVQESDTLTKFTPNEHLKLPFFIQVGYVYQIFGLPNLDGSYYFQLNSDNKLIVQFFDSGPW